MLNSKQEYQDILKNIYLKWRNVLAYLSANLVNVSSHPFTAVIPCPTDCTDSCDGLPDGQYPTACKECPHYFRCRNGILTYKKCRGNLCYYPVTCRCQRRKSVLLRTTKLQLLLTLTAVIYAYLLRRAVAR